MSYTKRVEQLIKENKTEEAVELLIEAVESEPDEALHLVNLGTLLFQHKQYEEAKAFFLQALQQDEQMATAHYGLASIDYELGHYKDAAKALRACIALEMEDAHVYYLLGMSYIHLKNPLLASPFLQRATELEENVAYLFQYGLTLAKLEHDTEAKNVFEHILTIDENHADTLYNLAVIYMYDNHIKKAIHLLERTLELESNHQLASRLLEQIKEQYK